MDIIFQCDNTPIVPRLSQYFYCADIRDVMNFRTHLSQLGRTCERRSNLAIFSWRAIASQIYIYVSGEAGHQYIILARYRLPDKNAKK